MTLIITQICWFMCC